MKHTKAQREKISQKMTDCYENGKSTVGKNWAIDMIEHYLGCSKCSWASICEVSDKLLEENE